MKKNRQILCHLAAPLVTLYISVANASNTQPELIGVWRGTLGKHQIIVCWDQYGGNYYKLQHPLRISLNLQDQKSDAWLENEYERTESTISWQLREPSGNHLVGTQTKSPKDLKLPIRLTRVQVAKKEKVDQQDCNFNSALHDTFNAPRVAATQIHIGEQLSFMNKPYRAITALNGNVASVELIGEDESVAKANKLLRKEFMSDIGSYLSCEDSFPPRRGDFQSKVRLRFRNDEWLSWSAHVEGYCGGAHPFFGNSTNTIDLHSGKKVNLWDWLNLKFVKKRDDTSDQICEFLKNRCLPAGLAKRVRMTRPTYGNGCEEMNFHEMSDGGYSIGLNENGIAFIPELAEPARLMRTCYANYTISFAELIPYLNQSGLAAINNILSPSPDEVK